MRIEVYTDCLQNHYEAIFLYEHVSIHLVIQPSPLLILHMYAQDKYQR